MVDFYQYFKFYSDPESLDKPIDHMFTEEELEQRAVYKFSDFMQPLRDTICEMTRVEECEVLGIEFSYLKKNHETGEVIRENASTGTLYSVPYLYESPTMKTFVETKKEDLSETELLMWRQAISARILPIIKNSLDKKIINDIDINDNLCILLHGFNGEYVLLQKDFITDISCVSVMSGLVEAMSLYNIKKRDEAINVIKATMNDYITLVQFVIKGIEDDPDTYYQTIKKPMRLDLANEWSWYILNMYYKNAKVILLP